MRGRHCPSAGEKPEFPTAEVMSLLPRRVGCRHSPRAGGAAALADCGSDVIKSSSRKLFLRGHGCRHCPNADGKPKFSAAAVTSLGVVDKNCCFNVLVASTSPEHVEKSQFSTAAVTLLSCGRNLEQRQLHKQLCKEAAKILGSM